MRRLIGSTLLALLALAAPASAEVAHTVQPGETLWSIAAANNLTTRTSPPTTGSPRTRRSCSARRSACRRRSRATPRCRTRAWHLPRRSRHRPQPQRRRPRRRPCRAATPCGPGDTLSGLAAGAGVSIAAMAAMNGLDPAGLLIAGTVIKLPTGAPAPAALGRAGPARRSSRRPIRRRPQARVGAARRAGRRRRSTASPRRSPRRSRGRRAASTTRWSRPPTRAA